MGKLGIKCPFRHEKLETLEFTQNLHGFTSENFRQFTVQELSFEYVDKIFYSLNLETL